MSMTSDPPGNPREGQAAALLPGERKDRLRGREQPAAGCPASGAYRCERCALMMARGKGLQAGRQAGRATWAGVTGKPGEQFITRGPLAARAETQPRRPQHKRTC